jgi:hypothetical protein
MVYTSFLSDVADSPVPFLEDGECFGKVYFAEVLDGVSWI